MAVLVVGLGLGAPAEAVSTSSDSWRTTQEAIGSEAAVDFNSVDETVTATGNRQHVRLSIGWADWWTADFSAPTGRHLDPGETFVARSDSVGSSVTPGLSTMRDSTRCGVAQSELAHSDDPALSIGTFTVQEAAYDIDGNVTRFAVTFEENCQDTSQPALRGSLASGALNTLAPIPPPSPTPGPVTGLAVSNVAGYKGVIYDLNTTTLTWTNPADPSWGDTYVGYGGDFSWRPRYLGGQMQFYRGQGHTTSTLVEGIQTDMVFQVVPISTVGRLGPPAEIAVTGTRMPLDISLEQITLGGSTVLGGRLLESVDYGDNPANVFSGLGLAGRTLNVYSKPLRSPATAFTWIGRVTTGAGGRYTFTDSPDENTAYEVRWRGSPQYLGNSTYQEQVGANVAPPVDLVAARRQAKRGATVKFSTARSTVGSRSVVLLQRFDGHTWKTVRVKRISHGLGGRVTQRVVIRYRATGHGRQPFRLVKPGDARHVNGLSRTVSVTVH